MMSCHFSAISHDDDDDCCDDDDDDDDGDGDDGYTCKKGWN